MRIGRRQALIIAVACGVLAAALSYMYLRRASTPKQPENDVAINLAANVDPGMVTVKQVNQDQAPQGSFKNEAECQGWVAISVISAGDPITQTNVRQQADINALSYKVPQDMRAVTVFVDEVQGVSGLIKPGDRVDVLATFDLKDETAITRTVLQDTLVLALSTTMVAEEAAAAPAAPAAEGDKGKAPAGGAPPPPAQGDNAKKYPTVTLAVTPGDAQKLVLADSKGKIRLSLRRAGDSTYATVPAANNWELIGQRPSPPEEKPASQAQQAPSWYPSPMGPSPGAAPPGGKPAGTEKPGVEVFRGNQREVVQP